MAVKKSTEATPRGLVAGSTGDVQRDRLLSHLLEMGFDHEQSLEALQATDYDLTKASAMLAQQSIDYGLSSTPTKDSMEDSIEDREPPAKKKDGG